MLSRYTIESAPKYCLLFPAFSIHHHPTRHYFHSHHLCGWLSSTPVLQMYMVNADYYHQVTWCSLFIKLYCSLKKRCICLLHLSIIENCFLKIPSKRQLFQEFISARRWEEFRDQLVGDIVARSNTVNWTSVHDVPYSIRMEEMVDIWITCYYCSPTIQVLIKDMT